MYWRWRTQRSEASQCFMPGNVAAVMLGASLLALPAMAQRLSDDQVRQLMIRESIQSYPGHCLCPFNVASNGSKCGRRSAYSRPGGYSPLCYSEDISQKMIDEYRRSHGRPE